MKPLFYLLGGLLLAGCTTGARPVYVDVVPVDPVYVAPAYRAPAYRTPSYRRASGRAAYRGNCPTPDSLDRRGRRCGKRAASYRPGGY